MSKCAHCENTYEEPLAVCERCYGEMRQQSRTRDALDVLNAGMHAILLSTVKDLDARWAALRAMVEAASPVQPSEYQWAQIRQACVSPTGPGTHSKREETGE